MAYVTITQIKAALPEKITRGLLDDEGDGAPDLEVWNEIVAAVTSEIDGKLSQRFTLPLSPVPGIVEHCAFVLAAELIYQRRGYYAEDNPWAARAQSIRGTQGQQGGQPGTLDRLVNGDEPLTPTTEPTTSPAVAITEDARTTSAGGNLMT